MGHLAITAMGDGAYYSRHAERDIAVAEAVGGYYVKGHGAGEPPAMLLGRALELLGLEETTASERSDELMTGTWSTLRHPDTGEALGSAMRRYATTAENLSKIATAAGVVLPEHLSPASVRANDVTLSEIQEAVAPHVAPEEVRSMTAKARADTRQARSMYDFTYSADKTISVLHVAAERAGDAVMADSCEASLRAVARTLHDYVADELGASRIGYHGKVVGGQSSGKRVRNRNLAVASHTHHTSREGDPQDHIHNLFLAKGLDDTGVWHTLDGQALFLARPSLQARASRGQELHLANELGLRFESAGDGSRRVVGVDAELTALFSKRRAVIELKADAWAERFQDARGYAPSAKERADATRRLAKQTRKAKGDSVDRADAVESYSAEADERGTSLDDAYEAVNKAIREHLKSKAVSTDGVYDAEAVIAAGLEQVNTKFSNWNRHHLYAAIDAALPDNWPPGTTEDQLHQITLGLTKLALQRENVVCLTPEQPLDLHVPAELADESGLSMFFARGREVMVAAVTLEAEAALLLEARRTEAPAIDAAAAQTLVDEAGLSADQAKAVAGILSSGRSIEVLIGPAGTGKSYTLAKLAALWPEVVSKGSVLGLTVSQNAADVLKSEGFPEAVNIARWLKAQEYIEARQRAGKAVFDRHKPYVIQPGQLVVVDEASMASTGDLDKVLAIVKAQGGKVLLTGDDRQLDAIGQGGALSLLANDADLRAEGVIHELVEVRRFRNADGSARSWEAAASLSLRVGQVSALDAYDDHGSIIDGDADEVRALAVEEAVAAHVSGRSSLVVVESAQEAAATSWTIRRGLIDAGRVDGGQAVALHDGTEASVGDLIQTRQNDTRTTDSADAAVSNRDVFVVTEISRDGSIIARRRLEGSLGASMTLAPDYVSNHVELAYAATVHAAQGRTVDVSSTLVNGSSLNLSLRSLYVSMTRGRNSNRAYVLVGGDDERSGLQVLSDIAERNAAVMSATEMKRDEQEAAVSLARLGPAWREAVDESEAAVHRNAVKAVLSDHGLLGPMEADEASFAFWAAVAQVAGSGVDPADALKSTLAGREIRTGRSIAQLLHFRLSEMAFMSWEPARLVGRSQEQDAAAGYLDRSPTPQSLIRDVAKGSVGRYARHLARVMDARVVELGHRVAKEEPAWAIKHLGEVPTVGSSAYERWSERAGAVAAYREQYVNSGDVDLANPIGRAPSQRRDRHKYADWSRANEALDLGAEAVRDVATMTTAELQETIRRWADAVDFAPPYVKPLLDKAHKTAIRYASRYEIERARSTQRPTEGRHLGRLRTDMEAAQEQVETLSQQHEERSRWWNDTAEVREAAHEARAEFTLRTERLQEAREATLPTVREELTGTVADRYDRRLAAAQDRSIAIELGYER